MRRTSQWQNMAVVLLTLLAGAGWLRSYSERSHARREADTRTAANALSRDLERQIDHYQDALAQLREEDEKLRALALGLRTELERQKFRADSAAVCPAAPGLAALAGCPAVYPYATPAGRP